MLKISNTKRTRFKLAIAVVIGLFATTFTAIHYDMEGLASTCVAGILSVSTGYVLGDSYRKSDKDETNKEL